MASPPDNGNDSRLGSGVRGLIPGSSPDLRGELRSIEISKIEPNPDQPRQDFPEAEIERLADSIEQHGLLQPLLVKREQRPESDGDPQGFVLIAGHRRLKALKQLGRERAPAVVRSAEDEDLLPQALVENLNRSDLSPLETAKAFQRLSEERGMSHKEIAELLGVSRPHVSNTLRLLNLSGTAASLVDRGDLSPGHGRALLSVPEDEREALAVRAFEQGWSVRRLEEEVQESAGDDGVSEDADADRDVESGGKSSQIEELESRLTGFLGAPVQINTRGEEGTIEIDFSSTDDLNRILRALNLPDRW